MIEPSDADETAPQERPPARARRWRREYSYLALVGLLISIFAFLFFFLDINLEELRDFGYLGVFLVSLIGAASVVLPLPGAAVVVSSGQFVDDVLGIPFWLVVGVVAAAGETIGELTSYLAGVGGKPVIEDRPLYQRFERWMGKHANATMFVLSTVPNPAFDVAGFMAGAVRMPIWRFMLVVFLGKAIKNSLLALGGDLGLTALIDALE